jgi:poly(3-hydroxyalkanoate) synthetase
MVCNTLNLEKYFFVVTTQEVLECEKLFEYNDVSLLLQYVEWKSKGIATAVVIFPYRCSMSYFVFPSGPQNGIVKNFFLQYLAILSPIDAFFFCSVFSASCIPMRL